MGVGRRMKKQGPPEPLDEAHFTNLKRKAGMSVAESRAESQQYAKKRRTSGGDAEGREEGEKCEREGKGRIHQFNGITDSKIRHEEIQKGRSGGIASF